MILWSCALTEFPDMYQTVMCCSVSCVFCLISVQQKTTELRPLGSMLILSATAGGVDFRMKDDPCIKKSWPAIWDHQYKQCEHNKTATSASNSHFCFVKGSSPVLWLEWFLTCNYTAKQISSYYSLLILFYFFCIISSSNI